jgi:hypothetical protein
VTGAQPAGESVDLEVTFERLLAGTDGRTALGVQPFGQVGDRRLEGRRDRGEVAFVVRDQGRVGLGGQVVGQVEDRRLESTHGLVLPLFR